MSRLAATGGRRASCLLLAAVTVLATVLVMIAPGTAQADAEGTTGGTFATDDSSSPPAINGVDLYDTDNVAATDMSPTVERWIAVDVSDAQTLQHLTSIKVTIFYDADGDHGPVPTTVDNQTCAIITWTTPNTWTLTSMGAGSTWSAHAGVTPTLTANTGTFVFHFVPGKVATENAAPADWDIAAVATDAASGTDTGYLTGLNMNWYGEITGVSASVNFGSVALGDEHMSGALTATYISNGNYDEQARTDAQWINGSYNVDLQASGAPGDGEFTLWVDDEGDTAGETQLDSGYVDIDFDETITSETGDTNGNIHLWLALGSTGIVSGTYTGDIYFKISDR